MKYNRTTCRLIPSKDGLSPVLIRVTYNGKRLNLYTGISCDKDRWDKKRNCIKQGSKINGFEYNVLNEQIRQQEAFVDDYFNSSAFRSQPTSLADLKERHDYKYKRSEGEMSDEFFYLFDKFIKEQGEQRSWDKSMKEAFTRLMALVKEYKPNITFADLSISTMDGLKVFLSQTMLNDTLDKRLSYFRQFVKWAQSKNYKVHEEFASYKPKLPKNKIAVKYLEKEEVEKIYNLTFEPFSTIDIVRDAFIFQCFTALRYSDVSALTHDNIIQNNEGYEIDILTEKDDDRVRYPLSRIATEIYEKYHQYEYPKGVVFPLVSNQKYNKHLKEIGKLAELQGEWIGYQYRLNEKIVVKTPKSDLCSHTARRTFITLAAQAGAPLDLIAQITSHSEVEAMKPYIAKTRTGAKLVIDTLDGNWVENFKKF